MKHAGPSFNIADGYEVWLKISFLPSARYRPDVRVTRSRDGRVIFPFDGCPRPADFASHAEAVEAAHQSAEHWIRIDQTSPE
ncbi:DUF6723 family protein [Paraburkholderia tropica]|uniref:DUF6723 family protein n=1 Tax=Paraburkholderia tropica TaxID=92647 RepID=UPI003AFB04FA